MRLFACALLLAGGCASYVGSARGFSPARLASEPGWIAVTDVRYAGQRDESDCGAAAIGMVVGYWTRTAPDDVASRLRPAPAQGIRAATLRDLAQREGLDAFLIQGSLDDLAHELAAGRPVLVGLMKPQRRGALAHYEVVVAWHPAKRAVVTLDPAAGWRVNGAEGFLAEWEPAQRLTLVVAPR